MKVGYPCINTTIGCTPNRTFRLASYSEDLLISKVSENLTCLKKTLEYNLQQGFLFFRMGSGLIPFASHEVNTFNWQEHFKKDFEEIGALIKKNDIRISMHPDQFVLINALNEDIVKRSIKELEYHCDVLDLMGLDETAKVQIHVGGVYGNKEEAIKRFIENYKKLPEKIKRRLAVENDDRLFSLKDCLEIHKATKIPIIFDFFHHAILNNSETMFEAVTLASKTWKKKDGILMTDYSSQEIGERKGKHIYHIDINDFRETIIQAKDVNFDIMLEIKNKEVSCLLAKKELRSMKLIR